MDNPYSVNPYSSTRQESTQISVFSSNDALLQRLKEWFGVTSYRFNPVYSEEELFRRGALGELLILDIRFRSPEGLPFIRRIKDIDPSLPILVCMSKEQQGLGHTAVALGADDFILETELQDLLPRFLRRALEKRVLDHDLSEVKRLLSQELARRNNQEEQFKTVLREVLEPKDVNHREMIKNFSRILSVSQDLDQLVPLALMVLKDYFHVSRIGLFLDEAGSGDFNLRGGIGIPEELYENVFGKNSGIATALAKHGTILYSQGEYDGSLQTYPLEVQRELDLLLCQVAIPLFVKGKMVGFLVCNNQVSGKPLSESDLTFLFSLCGQIGVAVENARLYSVLNVQKGFLDSVLSNVLSGVITVDNKEEIKTFNPKAQEILGVPAGEMLFRNFRFLPSPLVDILKQTLHEGKSFHRLEIRLSGSERPIGVSTSELKGSKGESLGCVIVFADLTDVQKQHEWRRQQDNMEFVNKVAMRSSHELKNCLVSIRTFTQLLPDKYADEQFRSDFYQIVNHEVDRLTLLVDNLNFFAQPLEVYCVPTSLEKIFEEALSLISNETKEGIDFIRDFSLEGVELELDPENMKKVFYHCLLNAIQASPDKGAIAVKVRKESAVDVGDSKEKVDFISIQFHDSGNGMPKEEVDQAFEPFFTTKNQGIGLGLTIVKKIVDAHSGKVSIQSEVGKGTVVSIKVPTKKISHIQLAEGKQDLLQSNESPAKNFNS